MSFHIPNINVIRVFTGSICSISPLHYVRKKNLCSFFYFDNKIGFRLFISIFFEQKQWFFSIFSFSFGFLIHRNHISSRKCEIFPCIWTVRSLVAWLQSIIRNQSISLALLPSLSFSLFPSHFVSPFISICFSLSSSISFPLPSTIRNHFWHTLRR